MMISETNLIPATATTKSEKACIQKYFVVTYSLAPFFPLDLVQ